jgi:hypothetical protein
VRGIVSVVLVRLALVALSAVLVVVLSVRAVDHRACEDARRDLFGSLTGKAQRDAGDIKTIEERCRGTGALVATAGALRTAGDDAGARRLAREAVEREPESFSAQRALAVVAAGAEARAAIRRAGELNPRWAQARAARSPPAVAGGEGP